MCIGLTACSGDKHSTTVEAPLSRYAIAQQDYIASSISSESTGTYGGLIHIAEGLAPPPGSFDDALEKLRSRTDTADFNLPGLLLLLYRYTDSEGLDASLFQEITTEVQRFKYWPDELEPVAETTDAQNMVTWTENHYILFSSSAYLAGQLYPDHVFPASGRTGREQMEAFRPRILKWLELRFASGFSEWLSNVYYNEDMPALLALIELADDEEIVEKSRIVLDLMFADMALNHFQGNFGSTHGRTYTHKMDGTRDSTRGAMHLAFGLHTQKLGDMTASLMALSDGYRVPGVLYEIAHDSTSAMENRQRMGIRLEEADSWGLSLDRLEDGMSLLTMEPYSHPLFADLFYDMLNAYDWWGHRDFAAFNEFRSILDDPDSRAAQIENVVVTLYDVETRDGLYYSNQPRYTHAFLPRGRFDETLKQEQWFFARQGDAYLALWSSDPAADWVENADPDAYGGQAYEIIANGQKTIWSANSAMPPPSETSPASAKPSRRLPCK